MKPLILLSFYFLSVGFLHAQLSIDLDVQEEIKVLVENFHSKSVKKFTVKYSSQFNKQHKWRQTFKYRFRNDSLLYHRRGSHTSIYRYANGNYDYVLDKRDSIAMAKILENYVYVKKDSVGFKNTYSYEVIDGDSTLKSVFSRKIDGQKKTDISQSSVNGQWSQQKTIYTTLADNTTRTESFLFRNERWYPFYDITETLSDDQKEKEVIHRELRVGKQFAGMIASEKVVAEINSTRTSRYFYDDQGRIEKVTITTIDGSDKEVQTLLPKIKK